MYPFKFNPILKETIWGGQKLKNIFNKPATSPTTGESWEISAVKNNVSVVANGPLAGSSLQNLIDQNPVNLLGNKVYQQFGTQFPILIKFIDANQDLSIQVHPNDDLAKKRHNSLGKTEMWVVLNAEPNSKLIVGFNQNMSPELYTQHLNNGTLTSILNYENVSEGSAFFIKAGTIHAIGAGILIAEIQQTSDITYRVYDFDRTDKNGNKRELHTALALEAINYSQTTDFLAPYSQSPNSPSTIVSSPYFTTSFLHLTENYHVTNSYDSFLIYMCLQGSASFSYQNTKTPLSIGETVLIPASCSSFTIETQNAKLLQVHL